MPDAMPDALPGALLDALPPASDDAMPAAMPVAMPVAMHATQRNATNEESILRHLQSDHRNLPAEAVEICLECDRPAKVRGVCGACYERHRIAGTRHLLPSPKRHQHTLDGCPICDEVTALHAYGWDARTILTALHRNAEHVLRHLRTYDHPAADLFVPLATETNTHRRRKATR